MDRLKLHPTLIHPKKQESNGVKKKILQYSLPGTEKKSGVFSSMKEDWLNPRANVVPFHENHSLTLDEMLNRSSILPVF
jgi:hypothetical protein